jgi:curli biogenesis system outer membrane secretion channel CsgG
MKHRAVLLIAALAATGVAAAQTPGEATPSPERQAAHAALLQACDAEIKSVCADHHGREVMICLRRNTDKLGAACKDALSKLPRHEPPAAPPQ